MHTVRREIRKNKKKDEEKKRKGKGNQTHIG